MVEVLDEKKPKSTLTKIIQIVVWLMIIVTIGGGVSSMLTLSFIMIGTSMSSFLIVKNYKKNMKIINARKVSKNIESK